MAYRSIFVSCEHGGNDVPSEYKHLFEGAEEVLATHRGWDHGALPAARRIAERFGVPVHFATVTRLLADLNRGPASPTLLSEFSSRLKGEARDRMLARYHMPYRTLAEEQVNSLIARQGPPVLHLSIHSFTPVFDGVVRDVEIGLLYDPESPLELDFCTRLGAILEASGRNWRVRHNYPYRGTGEGLIQTLREKLTPGSYAGINLEFPQGLYAENQERWAALVEETAEAALQCTEERHPEAGGEDVRKTRS